MFRNDPHQFTIRRYGWILGLVSTTLLACPQLLDDRFSLAASKSSDDPPLILTGSGGGTASGHSGDPIGSDAGKAGTVNARAAPDASAPNAEVTDAGGPTEPSDNGDGSTSPDCDDGIQNGNEQGVDCGGPCRPCTASALVHRYSFSDTGVTVVDAVGGASGTAVNAALNGSGALSLSGTAAFVNLPNGIISASPSATVEVWLTWHGGPSWQRVFDFGSSTKSEDVPDYGQTYLAFTPRGNGDLMLVTYSLTGFGGETELPGSSMLPSDRLVHVAVVVDDAAAKLSLYLDGQLDASLPLVNHLTMINDVDDWLGQSQYASDPHLNADLTELRIYNRALDNAAIQASFAAGPDAAIH